MLSEPLRYSAEVKDPENPPRLLHNEIHIWKFSLERPEEQWQSLYMLLASDEVARANRFRFDKDRRHYIVGRGMMRALLGRYLNRDPRKILLTTGPSGKPLLKHRTEERPLQFNLTHSNGLALFAVGLDAGIGVDIEYIVTIPDAEGLAERFFSPLEYKLLQSLPEEDRMRAFYIIWVLNEACLKASGEGLSSPLAQIEVAPAVAQMLSINIKEDGSYPVLEWLLHLFTPAAGYIAALAVEDKMPQIVTRFLTDGSSTRDLKDSR